MNGQSQPSLLCSVSFAEISKQNSDRKADQNFQHPLFESEHLDYFLDGTDPTVHIKETSTKETFKSY